MRLLNKIRAWWKHRKLEKHRDKMLKKYGAITFCPDCGAILQENSTIDNMGDTGAYCFTCDTCGERSLFHYELAPVPVLIKDPAKEGWRCPESVADLFYSEIDELCGGLVDVFTQMAVAKQAVVARDRGIERSDPSLHNIDWDTDISPLHTDWVYEQERTKLDIFGLFFLVDTKTLIDVYRRIEDHDDFEDLLIAAVGKTTRTKKEHLSEFVYDAIGEEYIMEKCDDYGEPGYTKTEDDGEILFANWNIFPNIIVRILEYNGFDTEWSDEWIGIYDGESLAFREMPDGWGWQPSFFFYAGEPIPIERNEELYLESKINNPKTLVREDMDLEQFGFIDLEGVCHRSGWYGVMECPQEYFDKFSDEFDEIVVQACSIGPWETQWKVFGRKSDEKGSPNSGALE